jgi:hypothetical protein
MIVTYDGNRSWKKEVRFQFSASERAKHYRQKAELQRLRQAVMQGMNHEAGVKAAQSLSVQVVGRNWRWPDAVLDLRQVFEQVYDSGPYPARFDYNRPPVPALSQDDEAWADQLLQAAGVRTNSSQQK